MSYVNGNAPKGKDDADKLAARFQVIEPRWEKTRKRKQRYFSLWRQRWRDLRIILRHRYPDGIPSYIDIEDLLKTTAQILGDSLGLTARERTMWKITTVRPCDQTLEDLRKAKKRERDRRYRRAQNRQPRAEYLAAHSISRSKPWEAEGISRRTWYRRMAQVHHGTSPTPTTLSTMGDATAVPPDSPQAFPFTQSLGYLLRLWDYRQLTANRNVLPGLASCRSMNGAIVVPRMAS